MSYSFAMLTLIKMTADLVSELEVVILLSLTHVMVEKVLFLGQLFEMEILMDLHAMRSSESENHVFSV